MIIAPQCKPGSYNNLEYTPVCAWPEDAYVQWGGSGLVVRRESDGGYYKTAFFEAFLAMGMSTFIRGEGATLDEAEKNAFEKHNRYLACPGHEYERRGYTNGGGICKHCGKFFGKAFDEIPQTDAQKGILQQIMERLDAAEDPLPELDNPQDIKTAVHNLLERLSKDVK